MRMLTCIRLPLLLALLLVSTSNGQGQQQQQQPPAHAGLNFSAPAMAPAMMAPRPTVGRSDDCPLFHFYRADSPDAPFWNAPDGCRCVGGMNGINCGLCPGKDGGRSPCQHLMDNYCRLDPFYESGDTYKSYSCIVPPENTFAQTLGPDGKIDVYMDIPSGEGTMVVYTGSNVNNEASHVAQCEMTGCFFPPGNRNSNGSCEAVSCTCVLEDCDDFSKAILEDGTAGNPAEIMVTPNSPDSTNYPHKMEVIIETIAFPIEALCTASACTDVEEVSEEVIVPEVDDIGSTTNGEANGGSSTTNEGSTTTTSWTSPTCSTTVLLGFPMFVLLLW